MPVSYKNTLPFNRLPMRALAGAFCMSALMFPAHAQDTMADAGVVEVGIESDAADRIVLASRLRTLTQQVAAASCSITSQVDVEEAHDTLAKATTDFDRYIVALLEGDESLHILRPESNARIVRDIEHVRAEWDAIHGAIDSVLANSDDVDAAHVIDDHNLQLLELTSALAADLRARYANPYEITASDAMMVEIAGRQLMLTQRMAKDACEVWTGYNVEAARADLQQTMQYFESSLYALRDGMPAAGLQPAPTPEIQEDVQILLERWYVLRDNMQQLVDGAELTQAQKVEIFHDLQLELRDSETLLLDYRAYAERNHQNG